MIGKEILEANFVGVSLERAIDNAIENFLKKINKKKLECITKENLIYFWQKAIEYNSNDMNEIGVETLEAVRKNGYKVFLLSNIGQEE